METRVKLRTTIHYEEEQWITLNAGGFEGCVTPEEAAARELELVEANPVQVISTGDAEVPETIDYIVEIVDVCTV